MVLSHSNLNIQKIMKDETLQKMTKFWCHERKTCFSVPFCSNVLFHKSCFWEKSNLVFQETKILWMHLTDICDLLWIMIIGTDRYTKKMAIIIFENVPQNGPWSRVLKIWEMIPFAITNTRRTFFACLSNYVLKSREINTETIITEKF